MIAYLNGSSATLTLDLLHEDGSSIDTLSATYTLFDKNNAVVIANTPVTGFSAGDTTATIVIPSTANVLSAGELKSVRKITVFVTAAAGNSVQVDQTYIINSANEISFMVDSYQTVQEAELTAYDIPNLPSFNTASSADKLVALKEAFNRMGRITYLVDYNYLGGTLNYVTEVNTMASGAIPLNNMGRRSVVINKLNLLPMGYATLLPAVFIAKLKAAQVIEADFILGGDDASEDRQNGITTRKIGESTTTWRSTKMLSLPVSKRALEALTGYLYYGSILGRG
jgi:hypothetical protein